MLCKNFTVKRPVESILDILATGISLTLSAAVAVAEAEAFYFLFLLSNANSEEDWARMLVCASSSILQLKRTSIEYVPFNPLSFMRVA